MNIAAVSEQLTQLGINPAEAVIVGSGILGALGIRENRDVDVLVSTAALERLVAAGYHAFRYENGALGVAIGGMELMDDWFGEAEVIRANAVTVGGLRFMSLPDVRAWKCRLDRPKDRTDVALIDAYIARQKVL